MSKDSKEAKNSRNSSITTGVILLGVGTIFLLNNFRCIDIEESWPLILVVVGFALIVGSMRSRVNSTSKPTPTTDSTG